MPFRLAAVVASSVVAWPTYAQSQKPPEMPLFGATAVAAPGSGITLAAAVDAAWRRAVAAKEAEGQRRRAEAERSAADRLWASPPALEASYRDGRFPAEGRFNETEVNLVWPIWLPGQRAATGAVAEAAVTQADAAQAATRLRMAAEVREAAWTIVALQAESAEAASQLAVLESLVDDVERRVRAGDLARADALAARAEQMAALAQQGEVRQRFSAARGRWLGLTGLEQLPDAASIDERKVAHATAAATGHPELLLARTTVVHARERLDLARATRRDPPEVTVGVRRDAANVSSGWQYGGSVLVGVRVPFGTADRNEPLQAAARSEVEIAETAELRLRDRIEADTAAAREGLAAAEEQLAAEQERARLLRERALLVERAFRAGEGALPDLLRALAAATSADTAVVRQQAAIGLARARLHQSLGHLP
jgi:outer membrane protein TolC